MSDGTLHHGLQHILWRLLYTSSGYITTPPKAPLPTAPRLLKDDSAPSVHWHGVPKGSECPVNSGGTAES